MAGSKLCAALWPGFGSERERGRERAVKRGREVGANLVHIRRLENFPRRIANKVAAAFCNSKAELAGQLAKGSYERKKI